MKIYASEPEVKIVAIGLDVQLPDGWYSEDAEEYISNLVNQDSSTGCAVLATDFLADVTDSYKGVNNR